MMLRGLRVLVQGASLLNGLEFDPLTLFEDSLAGPDVDVLRRQIVQACFLRGPADTEIAVLIAGTPPEQAAVMAQRKKRAAARRGKAATRGKARKPAKSVRGKAAKRTSARRKQK